MKFTNKQKLPQPIVDAVSNDPYSRGDSDISVTQLLAPPRQVALIRDHKDEIVEDVSERIWSLVGQVMHGILERANTTGIAERRLSIDVAGWMVSGGMDAYYQDGLLQDYKFVTSYKFKDGSCAPEYVEQLNCYATILRANGHPVKRAQIVGIIRDWSKLEAMRDPSYPQFQVVVVDVPLWEAERALSFMKDRVILHQQARLSLPLCTSEERWAKPTVYAVMKQGKDRAVKLYPEKTLAESHASTDKSLYVETRPGENTRCKAYCSALPFCSQARGKSPKHKEPASQADEREVVS